MKPDQQQRIFGEWLDRHRGLLFKVVRAYAFNAHDQQDLFQEIATQVWNSVPKFRGESAVTTWIYRVALYAAIAWSKKERKHRTRHRTIDGNQYPLLQAAATSDPRLDWLYEQIAQLDEIDRSLTLMMLDGFSYKEIGATLGITPSHVGVKLNRIKKRLTAQSVEEINNEV